MPTPREKPRFHTERPYILALQSSKLQITPFQYHLYPGRPGARGSAAATAKTPAESFSVALPTRGCRRADGNDCVPRTSIRARRVSEPTGCEKGNRAHS